MRNEEYSSDDALPKINNARRILNSENPELPLTKQRTIGIQAGNSQYHVFKPRDVAIVFAFATILIGVVVVRNEMIKSNEVTRNTLFEKFEEARDEFKPLFHKESVEMKTEMATIRAELLKELKITREVLELKSNIQSLKLNITEIAVEKIGEKLFTLKQAMNSIQAKLEDMKSTTCSISV